MQKYLGFKVILVVMGIYTFALIYTIHKYEASIKQYKEAIGDYKRALSIKNNDHYAYLQVQNLNLQKSINELDGQNKVLQNQIEMLKLQNTELRSGIYTKYPQPNIYETQVNFE